jgi:alkylation response protein AidB-like acyl-CoA dehydrogenase
MTALAPEDSLQAAAALAAEFRRDAAERDLAATTPKPQRDAIRASGLLAMRIPTELGGIGASWSLVLQVVREIASADASLAHLFAYHHLDIVTPHLMGTVEQRTRWYSESARGNAFWGNCLNPLDPRTSLAPADAGTFRLNGIKSFCTGASDSDRLLVSAALPGVEQLQVMVLPTQREGVLIHDDWDNMGQRQTDSGTVSFHDVLVHSDELLGPPGAGGSVFASLRPCVTQSILSNIFLGIAQGAFAEAHDYVLALDRPFPGAATRPSDDPYVLEHFGEMTVQLESAAPLLDAAAEALESAWQRGDNLTREERGECAARVSLAKAAAGRCALDVTATIFEVMGARATSARYRFDRFWRNARTLTLHDPLDYKVREVGDWALNGRYPTPGFYS